MSIKYKIKKICMDLNLHSIRLTYYCRSHLCTTLTLQGGYTLGTKFLYTYFSFMQAGVHAHTHTHSWPEVWMGDRGLCTTITWYTWYRVHNWNVQLSCLRWMLSYTSAIVNGLFVKNRQKNGWTKQYSKFLVDDVHTHVAEVMWMRDLEGVHNGMEWNMKKGEPN